MGHPCRVPDAHGGKRLISPLKMSGGRRARIHFGAGIRGWNEILGSESARTGAMIPDGIIYEGARSERETARVFFSSNQLLTTFCVRTAPFETP